MTIPLLHSINMIVRINYVINNVCPNISTGLKKPCYKNKIEQTFNHEGYIQFNDLILMKYEKAVIDRISRAQ